MPSFKRAIWELLRDRRWVATLVLGLVLIVGYQVWVQAIQTKAQVAYRVVKASCDETARSYDTILVLMRRADPPFSASQVRRYEQQKRDRLARQGC